MKFTTIVPAILAILTPLVAALSAAKHDSSSSPCGQTCMHRLLYNTAYSSAASGIGMVMDAYDSRSHCLAEPQRDICPDFIRQTVSDIAGAMMKTAHVPSNGVTHDDFLESMADVSRRAARLGMSCASLAVTTPDMPRGPRYDSMAWTLHRLSTHKSSNVNEKKLQQAIANHPAGKPNPGSLKEDKYTLLGSDTPSYILGPLMGGPGPCLDAILCSPDVFATISPVLIGALDEGVLPKDAFLLYLLESAHGSGKVKRGGEPSDVYSFEYAAWLKRPSHGGQGHQMPPKNYNVDKAWHHDMESHEPKLRSSTQPGEPQLFRSEEFQHETGMVRNRILQFEKMASNREDRQSFRELGADGKWRKNDRELNPSRLQDITDARWQGMADDQLGELETLRTKGGEPVLDSTGSPILRKVDKGKTGIREAGDVLSLEPVGQAVRTDNGHNVQKFDMRDADGVRMQGINAWLDDLEPHVWDGVRLGINNEAPWNVEGGPSSERPGDDSPEDDPPKDDPPKDDPPDSQPPKQDPPKDDSPKDDPPKDNPTQPKSSDGDSSHDGNEPSSSSSSTNGHDNPSDSSDDGDSDGSPDGDVPPLQLPPPLVLPPPPPAAPGPPPPGSAPSDPDDTSNDNGPSDSSDHPTPPDSPGTSPPGSVDYGPPDMFPEPDSSSGGTSSTDDTHTSDPDYVSPPGSAPGSPPSEPETPPSEPGAPDEPEQPRAKPSGKQLGKPTLLGGPAIIPPVWSHRTHAPSSTSSGLVVVTLYRTSASSSSSSSLAVTTALPVSASSVPSTSGSTSASGPVTASGDATTTVFSTVKPSSASPFSSTPTRALVTALAGSASNSASRGSFGGAVTTSSARFPAPTGATTFVTVVQSAASGGQGQGGVDVAIYWV
ncbi:hypothetical protein B0A55_01073 [Friedmanniomyces simplex]|uniref:Uncharacterized protein n=1 Tax=Friedmanniomyces simplex TaxID=329884 RepID=A0A4U0Y3T2_9PEZI|nr:hypothetical protein B0A55_01073 [Friedmanniomyces simplex]